MPSHTLWAHPVRWLEVRSTPALDFVGARFDCVNRSRPVVPLSTLEDVVSAGRAVGVVVAVAELVTVAAKRWSAKAYAPLHLPVLPGLMRLTVVHFDLGFVCWMSNAI